MNRTLTGTLENDYNYNSKNEIQVQREQFNKSVKYLTDINKRNHDLKNQGYVESIKQENVVRILALNLRGFGPKNKEKINMLKKAMVEWKIDVVLMSSIDRR